MTEPKLTRRPGIRALPAIDGRTDSPPRNVAREAALIRSVRPIRDDLPHVRLPAIASAPARGTVCCMTGSEVLDDRPTAALTAMDHVDLVNCVGKRSPRMRAMLWAMAGPDGLVCSAFGSRSFVHDAAIKAQTAALRAGFVVVAEWDSALDESRTRVERRWRPEFRAGVAALALWRRAGLSPTVFMRSLGEQAREPQAARLLAALSEEPAKAELLPDVPHPQQYGEWLTSAIEVLDLIDGHA